MILHFYLARNRATFEQFMQDRGTEMRPMDRNVHRLIEEPEHVQGIRATNCRLHLLEGWRQHPDFRDLSDRWQVEMIVPLQGFAGFQSPRADLSSLLEERTIRRRQPFLLRHPRRCPTIFRWQK